MRKLAILGAAMCLLLAACGDDDGNGGDGSARSEIAASLLEEADGELTGEQADCVAEAMIEGFGEDDARAFAEDPENWEPELDPTDIEGAMAAATAMMSMFADCGLDDALDAEDMAELDDAIQQLEDLDLDALQQELDAEINN